MSECKHTRKQINTHGFLYCFDCGYVMGPRALDLITTMQARIDALKKAFNELEASSVGPVTRMREANRITVGYKEFCTMAALLEAEK